VKGYREAPATLGEHLRKRRLDLRQTQKQVAAGFHICPEAYSTWETGRHAPEVHLWPEIISFLGYDPTPPPRDFDQALTMLQMRHGLRRDQLAVRLGIERKTSFNWLAGKTVPSPKAREKVSTLCSRIPYTFHACSPVR
jgi:transcriptional regulator with XRE-family HTH domain